MAFTKKYYIPHPWNVRYARSRCQARYRREEWAFTPETWYRHWQNSGVMEHCTRKSHGYCMVRLDPIEAWGPHNCIIVPRRQALMKILWEGPRRRSFNKTPWSESDDVTPVDKRCRDFGKIED
jgi:hypothetical protein